MANRFNKLFQFLKPTNEQTVQPIQIAENGGLDLDASLDLAARQPRNLIQHLTGRNLEIDTSEVNPETNEITTEKITKFQPGFFTDLASGARENFEQEYSPRNLEDKIGLQGQNKGLAYRIGEGLGTTGKGLNRGANLLGKGLRKVGQFADTPLGRGVITAGIVGLTGGGALPMLAYGGTAGLTNQQNRMKDQMYRNELSKMGFDTTGINGYIGDDTFNKIFQSKQLQDNAEYRNALLAIQKLNQEADNRLAEDKFNYQRQQDARDYYLNSQRVAQGWANVEANREKANQNKNAGSIANLQAVNQQLQRFEDSFKNMPNKLESNTLGRLRNFTGLQTQTEANFNSQRQLLFNKIARDLGGEKGVLSDQDIKRIEGALPSYTDSYVQKQAKMQAIYDLLNDRLSVEGGSLGQTTQGGTTQVGKYKVRVK